jgi:IS605 OrfB family transposase
VTEAERTSRGIALEDLTGIRDRARLRRPQRVTLSSWAFAQLGSFIGYKARRAGVPVIYVDPAWTSRTCADCGHADKRNRVSQARFTCRGCGVVAHAERALIPVDELIPALYMDTREKTSGRCIPSGSGRTPSSPRSSRNCPRTRPEVIQRQVPSW